MSARRGRDIPTATLLARLPLFTDLAPAAVARLAAEAVRYRLTRGDVLFEQGEPARGVYVVVYGDVKLFAKTAAGGQRLTGVAGPGHSFGEPVMFLERLTVVQARAATDALVVLVPKATVFAELDSNPKFARQMIAGLSARVHALVAELDRQAAGSGAARFVAYLLREADGRAAFNWTLPATKREIATQLNLTAEHFSRVLRELTAAGLIEVTGRRIAVPDTQRLAQSARSR